MYSWLPAFNTALAWPRCLRPSILMSITASQRRSISSTDGTSLTPKVTIGAGSNHFPAVNSNPLPCILAHQGVAHFQVILFIGDKVRVEPLLLGWRKVIGLDLQHGGISRPV